MFILDFEGPDRHWIVAEATKAGILIRRGVLATKIRQLMRAEHSDEEIWSAVKNHIHGSAVDVTAARAFFRAVIESSKARREYWAQWLPPSLVECKAPTLRQRASPPAPVPFVMQTQSPLLSLPPELRTQIFDYVLTLPSETQLRQKNTAPGLLVPREATQPALTRTCRQTRAEMLTSFYTDSTFILYIDRPRALLEAKRWITAIGDYNVGLIRSIILHGFEPDRNRVMWSVRYGVDLGNLEGKLCIAGWKAGLLDIRVKAKLAGMLAGTRGNVVDVGGLVELLCWFGGCVANTETGRVGMVVD